MTEHVMSEVTDGTGTTYRRLYEEYSWDPGDNRSDYTVLHDGLWLSVPSYNRATHPITGESVSLRDLPWEDTRRWDGSKKSRVAR